ncbi:MAG TPA: DUF898 family protein [Alphaproteobacteria bacterium]
MSTDVAGSDPAAMGAASANVGFLDRAGLWKVVLGNFLLTIVTLGIYRFWAKTRIRRYFWSNITILGEPLEYTGTGRELFVGFLIVLAILAPLIVAYYVLQRILLGNPIAILVLLVAYFVLLFVLIHIAVFRARRYQLTRTVWRGIRAGQTGSSWGYVGLAVLYTVISVVTLGLASPWMEVGLERYKMNNTWFGNSQFRLKASGFKLFLRSLVVYALFFVPVIVAYAANFSWLIAAQRAGVGGDPGLPPPPEAFLLFFVAVFAGVPSVVWYTVAKFRYFANSTSLGEIRLKSAARTSSVLGYVIVFVLGLIGLVILLAIVVSVVAGVAAVSMSPLLSPDADPVSTAQAARAIYLVALPIVFLLYLPLYELLSYCWLQVSLVRHFATTLTIENIGELGRIAQAARQNPRFGEGLADALDVGVGVL